MSSCWRRQAGRGAATLEQAFIAYLQEATGEAPVELVDVTLDEVAHLVAGDDRLVVGALEVAAVVLGNALEFYDFTIYAFFATALNPDPQARFATSAGMIEALAGGGEVGAGETSPSTACPPSCAPGRR